MNPSRDLITPKISVWAIEITEEMLVASSLISFLEEVWKATFPGPAKIKKFGDIAGFLKDSAKEGLKAYLKGEKKLMVKSAVKWKWSSIVRGYFQGIESIDEGDFAVPETMGDRLRKLLGN